MRNAFSDELTKLATADSKIILLSADIGNKLFDKLKANAPKQVLNTGVAEANTIGVAAGLAMCGLKPIAYTITPFITTRCLEQIRVDLAYHNLPVLFVGVGAGLGYAELGPTHHSCEDISFIRSIPEMTVLCPGDPAEVRVLLQEALKQKGPVYMRIGKKGEEMVHSAVDLPKLKIGKAYVVYESKNMNDKKENSVCLISTGNTLPLCVETAKKLESKGLHSQAVSFHTVKPIDKEFLEKAFSNFSLVVTIEEHGLIGGLGSAVAEWKVDENKTTRLLRFGTRDEFMHVTGSQEYAREHFGLTEHNIIEKVLSCLNKKDSHKQ